MKQFLDQLAEHYQSAEYIRFDPISIPHGFDDPADQEIIGLFAALLAWGRRDTMLRKLEELCERMNYHPARFVRDFRLGRDESNLEGFKHRTFQPDDASWLCRNLSACLKASGSLEQIVRRGLESVRGVDHIGPAIEHLSSAILGADPDTPARLSKHLARPSTGSACKRLCLYIRWMSRPGPFDLGVWTSVDPSSLVLPLDVHSGRQARRLGLLVRPSDDWRSALELTASCRALDRADPARYDFAFFGLGAFGVPSTISSLAPRALTSAPTMR
jgi:uncharacterized protein (TIGR02757 family)